MKKLLTFIPLIALCASIFPHLFTHAQEQSLSSPERAVRQQKDLARFFRQHERVKFNTNEVAEQVRNNIPLSIYTASASFDVVLKPHDMRAKNYRAVEVGADGVERTVKMGPVRTYKGEVIGRDDARARFTIDDETLEGLIITPEERYMVEPMSKYSAVAEPMDFILYKSSDVIEGTALSCPVTMDEEINQAFEGVAPQMVEPQAPEAVAALREIELATEADYEYYKAKGSSSVTANQEILSIMNQVEGVYESQLSLTFKITYQNTWAANTDPYVSSSITVQLDEFTNYWNANRTNIVRDVAHLWTGKNVGGGLAWSEYNFINGVVCRTRNLSYGLSQGITWVPQKYILTAHEIGHNLSATHAEGGACANTIMNGTSGPNTALSFCTTSRNQITSFVNTYGSCLTTAPACTYTISPTSKSFTSAGGSGSVSVTAGAGCSRTATSNAAWVTITAGSSGTGNGTVSYTVASNTGTTSRTGTLTIAGKTFTITQAGAVVTGPTLSLLRLGLSTVAGCKSVTGTVTLSAPAPARGVVVTISDNLAAARPPATVTIPAGATSKTFTITTVHVFATQVGNITAKLGAVTKTARLTLRPVGVQTLLLSPSSVIGPAPSTGTVILECAAPINGIFVVLLTTNAPVASPNSGSMTIPQGATSKTFTVNTADVATSHSVIITAGANSIGKTRTLTVR